MLIINFYRISLCLAASAMGLVQAIVTLAVSSTHNTAIKLHFQIFLSIITFVVSKVGNASCVPCLCVCCNKMVLAALHAPTVKFINKEVLYK